MMTDARAWPLPYDRDACLDCLAEMAGAVVMAVARARRHGLDVAAPGADEAAGTNLVALRSALADLRRAADLFSEGASGAKKPRTGARAGGDLKAIPPHPDAVRLRLAGVSPEKQCAWFRGVTFTLAGDVLVIRTASRFVRAEIAAQWEWHLRRAWGAAFVRYEAPEGTP